MTVSSNTFEFRGFSSKYARQKYGHQIGIIADADGFYLRHSFYFSRAFVGLI